MWRLVLVIGLLIAGVAEAAPTLNLVTSTPNAAGGQTYSVTIQVLAMMTALTVLPAILLMMTSFTRIVIVLSLMRQAIGTTQTPTNQILIGLALFLTMFVMAPVFERVHNEALAPYLEDKLDPKAALEAASKPMKEFMLAQTREDDLNVFVELSGRDSLDSRDAVPLTILIPAFVTSELKTAFQIGFIIFIPFLVIDMVVSSILMSMGMMMLSPMVVSVPFKIMLFVLVDGWTLVLQTLATSFYV
jgi:flagellar biosynthesis protein FliP